MAALAVLVVGMFSALGQALAGPGGLNSDVTWILANKGHNCVNSNNCDVGTINDFSPSGNSLGNPTGTPLHLTNALNFNSVIRYDAGENHPFTDESAFVSGADPRSFFVVLVPGNADSERVVRIQGNAQYENNVLRFDETENSVGMNGHRYGNDSDSDGVRIATFILPDGAVNTDEWLMYSNGEALTLEDLVGNPGAINTNPVQAFLGSENDTVDVAEFIALDVAASDSERNQVESYLAVKYGMTLEGVSYSLNGGSDTVNMDGFNTNVAGIANDGDSDLVQLQSSSVNAGSVLTLTALNNGLDLNNGEFLLTGRADGTSAITFTDADVPAGWERLDATWKVVTEGNPDEVRVEFDKNEINDIEFNYGGGLSYSVLVDNNGDGTFDEGEDVLPVQDGGDHFFVDYAFPANSQSFITLAVQPLVEFSSDSFAVTEGGNEPISVRVLGPISSEKTLAALNEDVNDDQALTAETEDYVIGTLIVPADDYADEIVNIDITAFQDLILENDETFRVTLETVDNGSDIEPGDVDDNANVQATTTITILDDDSLLIGFDPEASSDSEADGGDLPQIKINGADIDSDSPVVPFEIHFNVPNTSTATYADFEGSDAFEFNGDIVSVTVPEGDYGQQEGVLELADFVADFAITNDDIVETDETLIFDLVVDNMSDPIDIDGGYFAQTTYTIENDDKIAVELAGTSESSGDEGGNENYTPVLLVTGEIADDYGDIVVDLLDAGSGTAETPADYAYNVALSGVTITPGSYNLAEFAFNTDALTSVLDDFLETDETIELELSHDEDVEVQDVDGQNGAIENYTHTLLEAGEFELNVRMFDLFDQADEDGNNNGRYRVRLRVANQNADAFNMTGEPLEVFFEMSGSAEAEDYNDLGTSVIINDGQRAKDTQELEALDDDAIENLEVATLTIVDFDQNIPNADNLSLDDDLASRSGDVEIIDNDTATLIPAPIQDGNEEGPVNGIFEFYLEDLDTNTLKTIELDQDLEFSYLVDENSSTAVDSDNDPFDYNALSGTFTILDGTGSAQVNVVVNDDDLLEATETVDLSVTGDLDPLPAKISLDLATVATVNILDNDVAEVSIVANDPEAAENPSDNGQFTVTMSKENDTNANIEVSYSIGGSATGDDAPDGDYDVLTGTVVIEPDSDTATIDVLTAGHNDNSFEGDEEVIITLTDTNNDAVTVGEPSEATVIIADDDVPTLHVESPGLNAVEGGGAQNIAFTLRASSDPASALVPNFTGQPISIELNDVVIGGTATSDDQDAAGQDYAPIDFPVNLLQGQSQVTRAISALDDDAWEAPIETVVVTVNATSEPAVIIDDATKTGTLNIEDADSGEIHILEIGPLEINEEEETSTDVTFEIRDADDPDATLLNGFNGGDLIAEYLLDNSTADAEDWKEILDGTVTIPYGSSSEALTVTAEDDNFLEANPETVVVTLDDVQMIGDVQPTFVQEDSVAIDIVDNNVAFISLEKAVDGDAIEGEDDGQFVVTLVDSDDNLVVNHTGVPITVNYNVLEVDLTTDATGDEDYTALSGSLEIAIDESSAVIDIDASAYNDDVYEADGEEYVTLEIDVDMPSSNDAVTPLNDPEQAVVTIVDDDQSFIVEFNATNAQGEEGTQFNVELLVDGSLDEDLLLEVQTVDGSALQGVHYGPTENPLLIPANIYNQEVIQFPIGTTLNNGEQVDREFQLVLEGQYLGDANQDTDIVSEMTVLITNVGGQQQNNGGTGGSGGSGGGNGGGYDQETQCALFGINCGDTKNPFNGDPIGGPDVIDCPELHGFANDEQIYATGLLNLLASSEAECWTGQGGTGDIDAGGTLNRATIATAITRAAYTGDVDAVEIDLPYTDADSFDDWYKKYLTVATQQGYVKGYGDGAYRPSQEVTLPELLVMLYRAAGQDIPDDPNGPWYNNVVREAEQMGIITGNEDFSSAVTRGDTIVYFGRMVTYFVAEPQEGVDLDALTKEIVETLVS